MQIIAQVRPIPGYPDYVATATGDIWCIYNQSPTWGKLTPFKKKPWWDKIAQRWNVQLTSDGKQFGHGISRIVALAWIGPPSDPELMACHKNGIATDNHYTNLYWGTAQQNQKDKVAHGRSAKGSNCGRSKLTEEIVIDIRRQLRSGISAYRLAKMYGVHDGTISAIQKRETWKHI